MSSAKCGVIATANFSCVIARPRRSEVVRRSSFSNCSGLMKRWRICQRQSFQRAGS